MTTRKQAILGIDTSNYMTSLAIMNLQGALLSEERSLLPVKTGNLGLRQSDALFHHIKNLPVLCKKLMQQVDSINIVGISASVKPRPLADSYMPVFLASQSFATSMASLMNVPFYSFSHQEGHIEAGFWSQARTCTQEFLVLHISGGTTEMLKVVPYDNRYDIEIVGGSKDISAGQLIDRIGVRLDMPFPAGPHLESLSLEWQGPKIKLPISVKEGWVNFSGLETHITRLLNQEYSSQQIASSLFHTIGQSLVLMIKTAKFQSLIKTALVVGGVASNQQIRTLIEKELSSENIEVLFGQTQYCSDNAVGIAALGVKSYLNRNQTHSEKSET
ncbi:O-sialoglycoprotein endopeptidase [Alkaliphilus metalliredigens QYMF]|uniref:N(6)-L-threonylcarbamoyladenine synthase n=1 Tax=Alkaliphilus metalliredigens (strain QYMF) TaxID=293826 RepID=A6TR37_ALKMQ|nr:O-sialoglycoprotein endopeptidase [Alkaliphilus metalliredigens]ABR48655.1 O-sialoglycoprotein endopeptidase [Alkaliphilus metalliredigens QYMF]